MEMAGLAHGKPVCCKRDLPRLHTHLQRFDEIHRTLPPECPVGVPLDDTKVFCGARMRVVPLHLGAKIKEACCARDIKNLLAKNRQHENFQELRPVNGHVWFKCAIGVPLHNAAAHELLDGLAIGVICNVLQCHCLGTATQNNKEHTTP